MYLVLPRSFFSRQCSSSNCRPCSRYYPPFLTLLLLALLTVVIGCSGGASSSNGNNGNSGSNNGGSGGGNGSGGGGGGNVSSGPFMAGRTKYVRTDATTEYFASLNPHWIIFNPLTNYLYVADPSSNRITVMDPGSESEVGVISVPGAYSIDDTADHKTLYVGTVIGDLYVVDPIAMKVVTRYGAAQIGPSGFPTISALVM